MTSFQLEFDSVARKGKVISASLESLRELLSAENKAAMFARKRRGGWGKSVFSRKYIVGKKGHFDLKFFRELESQIKLNFPQSVITVDPKLVEHACPGPISPEFVVVKPKPHLDPRDYQLEAAEAAVKLGQGVIVLPTSAGKTLVMAMITASALKANHKVLVLVPTIQLVQQTHDDFVEYGLPAEDISKWSGTNSYTPTKIVVVNHAILLSETQNTSVLSEFGVLIADEAHKLCSATKTISVVKEMNAKHTIGLTGSLPPNQFDVWNIIKLLGEVIYTKKSVELRDDKFISNVRVAAVHIHYTNIPEFTRPSLDDPTVAYREEIEFLNSNQFRNNVLLKLSSILQTNTLILVDRIEHGTVLHELLQGALDRPVVFIRGDVEVEEREKLRQLMEERDGVICIAISKIFSTGISINNLHNVIFASIGKGQTKIIQSIGRSLRLHTNKTIAMIFDIADHLQYGERHFLERLAIYRQETIQVTKTDVTEPVQFALTSL